MNGPQNAVHEQSLAQLAATITQHGGSRGPYLLLLSMSVFSGLH